MINMRERQIADGKEPAGGQERPADYGLIAAQILALAEEDPGAVPLLANVSSLIWEALDRVNWAGFYLLRPDGVLVLGPFQGKPACVHIGPGKGVCGTAAAEDRTVIVPDVHRFPGHIACDSASRSEIVVPIHKDGRVTGVLDIDSPETERFGESEREGLEKVVRTLEQIVAF